MAVPFASFNSAKDSTIAEGGFWKCKAPRECQIKSHLRNGSEPIDLMGLTGTMVGYLDIGTTGTQSIAYTWSYKLCYGPENLGDSVLWSIGPVTQIDVGKPCPILTPESHTGVIKVTDGNLTLKFDDGYDGKDFGILRYFVGDFDLQLTLPETSTIATSTTSNIISTTAISSISSRSSVLSIQNSTSTGPLASVPPPTISSSGPPTRTTLVGTDSPDIFPGVPPTQTTLGSLNSSGVSDGAVKQNTTNKIAGIAAGAAVGVLVLLLVALLLIRRRRYQASSEGIRDGVAPWTRRVAHLPTELDRIRAEKIAHLGVGDSNQFLGVSKPDLIDYKPPQHSAVHDSTIVEAPLPITQTLPGSPSTTDNVPTSPNPTLHTVLLPSYDMHPYHQIVTPRISVDRTALTDELRRWAERHNDVIPADLERRLRAGGFVPTTNPRDISKDVWERRFKVTAYELRGLQELYDITQAGPSGS